MTTGRLWGYGSLFSQGLAKTTAAVSQLASSTQVESMKQTLAQQYNKCQSGLQDLAASEAVAHAKENIIKCTNVAQQGLEKAKWTADEVLHSEPVKNLAASAQQGFITCQSTAQDGFDKAKAVATEYIGQDKIDSVAERCADYKNKMNENLTVAKDKCDALLKSDEIVRLKSIFDGSIDSILATNLLFELGLLIAPGSGPVYLTLQTSKFLIASCIFLISAAKSYDARKQDQAIQDKIEPYAQEIESAYKVMADLKGILMSVEEQLQKLNHPKDSTYMGSKDFELPTQHAAEVPLSEDAKAINHNMLLKSILEGSAKSAWLYYLLRLSSICLPTTNAVVCLKMATVMTTLVSATVSSLQKNEMKAENEAKISQLHAKLEPVFATMVRVNDKLSADIKQDASALDESIQELFVHNHTESSGLSTEIKSIAEGSAKASGLYLLLQGISPGHDGIEFAVSAGALLFAIHDAYRNGKKDEKTRESFKEFELRMLSLKEMTDKMTSLHEKQVHYEKYLKELNEYKIKLEKENACRLFQAKKAAPADDQKPEKRAFALSAACVIS